MPTIEVKAKPGDEVWVVNQNPWFYDTGGGKWVVVGPTKVEYIVCSPGHNQYVTDSGPHATPDHMFLTEDAADVEAKRRKAEPRTD